MQANDLENIKNFSDIKFCGFKKNIKKVIEDSHVVVLPSYYGEGVPKILIEACSIGRPIITTNIPGCREAVIDKKNGILINPQNVNSLTNAMETLILNKNKIDQMGEFSRKIAISKFNLDLVIKKHLKI